MWVRQQIAILAIPTTVQYSDLENMVVALDALSMKNPKTLQPMVDLAQQLKLSINLVHVSSDKLHTDIDPAIKDFLNNCVSIMGKREFDYMLLNRITNSDLLNKQYEITQYIIDNKKWEFLRSQLTSIRDS